MKITIAAILLTGCAGLKPVADYADSPKLRMCQFEAQKAVVMGNSYGARSFIGSLYGDSIIYRQILEACMAQY